MLFHKQINAIHLFLLLLGFWTSWLWSEYKEAGERANFAIEVRKFMERGNRFTADDGRAMEAQIEELRQRLEELKELEAAHHHHSPIDHSEKPE